MRTRTLLALACLLSAAPAAADEISVGFEATLGGQHLGVRHTPGGEPLRSMGDLGGTLLLKVSFLELGLAATGVFHRNEVQRYDASALGGLALDPLPFLRVELLGEIGAASLRTGRDLGRAASSPSGWHQFQGIRPGLSVALPFLPFRIGAWGLARWGLPGATRSPEYGFMGRLGVEF